MKFRSWMALCFILLISFSLVTGCAKRQIVSTPAFNWESPTGAYMAGDQPVFYGVGKASGIRSTTLLRATADNQAQMALGRLIRNYTNRLAKAAGVVVAGEEELVAFSELVQGAVARARIVDHWYDADKGTLYALCRLDLELFQHLLQAGQYLDSGIQAQMLALSADVHARMMDSPDTP